VIAFDTNVLVRLLVRDEPEQFAAATAILERAVEAGDACYLCDTVLCETEWVLTTVYDASRADVLAAFHEITSDGRFALEGPDEISQALAAYERGKAQLSDYLIGERSRARGARTTYTFDRGLRNREGFTLLD